MATSETSDPNKPAAPDGRGPLAALLGGMGLVALILLMSLYTVHG